MKVAFCWPEINGYMAACWRALQAHQGVDVLVLAGKPGALLSENAYKDELSKGLDALLLDEAGLGDSERVARALRAFEPNVVVLPGWMIRSFVKLAFEPALVRCRFILALDNVSENTWRQKLARLWLRRYLGRMDRVVVPGERGWQFAHHILGVPETRLRRGVYGIDFDLFAPTLERRARRPGGWPRRFLYVGRYVQEKGLDILIEAYSRYRRAVSQPWPLTCCGQGGLSGLLQKTAGVEERGFVQPSALPGLLDQCGVFVLPSRRDPWPLVLVEQCAAGLPVICTNACGSGVELVRPHFNGLVVPTGEVESLAQALRWMHEHHVCLPEMGRRSQSMAAPYSAEMWSQRWLDLIGEVWA